MNSVALATSNRRSRSQEKLCWRIAPQAPFKSMMKRIQQTKSYTSRKAAVRGFALIGGLRGQQSHVGGSAAGDHAAVEWCPSDRRENPAGNLPAFLTSNLVSNVPTLAILEGHP
jgi:hypothetical protein